VELLGAVVRSSCHCLGGLWTEGGSCRSLARRGSACTTLLCRCGLGRSLVRDVPDGAARVRLSSELATC